MRQCHQRTLRTNKSDPADPGRDQFGARSIPYGSYQGIRHLWSTFPTILICFYSIHSQHLTLSILYGTCCVCLYDHVTWSFWVLVKVCILICKIKNLLSEIWEILRVQGTNWINKFRWKLICIPPRGKLTFFSILKILLNLRTILIKILENVRSIFLLFKLEKVCTLMKKIPCNNLEHVRSIYF